MRKILYTAAHVLEETEDGYDLGRSTSNNLSFGEILDDALVAEIREQSVGYGVTSGDDRLRVAIARTVGLHSDHVLTTNGAIGALHLAIFCLCDQGDEVVTVTPGFPATFDLIQALGAVKKSLTVHFDDSYALDIGRLIPLLNERTKLVLLISPHNPSGVTTSAEIVAEVLHVMATRSPEACLLMDETFREASYGVHPAMPSFAPLSERVLTVSSLSKAHGAPGLRLGWITCTAPRLMRHLTVGKGKTAISGSVLDERLGAHILENAADILKDRNARLGAALGATEDWMAKNSALFEWIRPHAGGMCCVRLKTSMYGDAAVERFYRLAAERQINIATGDRFGDERRVFRLGFGALALAKYEAALDALKDTCRDALNSGA
jgi:aspartate/methionine/tyrosine aminotransferase